MERTKYSLYDELLTDANDPSLAFEQVFHQLLQKYPRSEAIEFMRDYCLQNKSSYSSRIGMEFLYMNGLYNDLQKLIHINKQSHVLKNKQWAAVYQLIIDRRTNKIPTYVCVQKLNRIHTDDIILYCLIELTKVGCYFDVNNYDKIGKFLDVQFELFSKIEDPFMLSCLDLRLHQQLVFYHWMRNEVIMARKYAFRALNQTNSPQTKASLHINLGLTYTFDTYSQGMYHFNEALKIAKENEMDKYIHAICNYNIPFISAHFNQVDGISSEDPSEQAHIEIAKGNYKRAIELLESIPLTSPFGIYYMGMAKQDEQLLMKSYNCFINRRSDYFFSRLPLNAMKNLSSA